MDASIEENVPNQNGIGNMSGNGMLFLDIFLRVWF